MNLIIEKVKNDIFYVCTLIEYIARKTKNHRSDIIKKFTKDDIIHELEYAEINHSLSFEQVSDEIIEDLRIDNGDFDTVNECIYEVPSVTSIGRVYQTLISSVESEDIAQTIIDVFSSFISDEISDFNSNVYYSNPDYIKCSYEAGYMLD